MPKDSNSTAVGRAPEAAREDAEFVSRKLIRPSLTRVENGDGAAATAPAPAEPRRERPKKSAATEQTHAENFYFQKQMQAKTLMTFVLKSGEEVQGFIDWYDKDCVRITRNGKPNLLLYKNGIRYLFKSGENTAGRG